MKKLMKGIAWVGISIGEVKVLQSSEMSNPMMQVDFMFRGRSTSILILIDIWSRYVKANPMKKGARLIAETLFDVSGAH